MVAAVVLVVGMAVFAAADAGAFLFGGKYTAVTPKDGVVRLEAAQFADGKARYFELKPQGKSIRFFVLKSPDGVLRSAFDACEVCFREGKGYSQDGQFMTCVNCGQKFHANRISELRGGCHPVPLAHTLEGGALRIQAAAIEGGARFFP